MPEQKASRRRSVSPQTARKGSILILALWSVSMLSIFAVTLGYEIRQKMMFVSRLDEREQLRYIAEAGIKKAIAELKKELEKNYDTLTDSWSNNIAFKDASVGNGAFTISYDYLDEASGILETGYGLIDEERKININKANSAVLERLFKLVADLDEMEAQEVAASIVDWRDSDSELSLPLGSAEDSYYRNLGHPYESKDADYEVLDEVLLVKGMTSELFERVSDYITIYGDGRVNINTASKDVLIALGLSEDMADKVITYRYGKDGFAGTVDDEVFKTPGEIVPKISQTYHLSDPQIVMLTSVSEQSLSTKSNNFTIKSTARVGNRKNSKTTICVADRSGLILYWQEG